MTAVDAARDPPGYRLAFDEDTRIVRQTLIGFWDVALLHAFAAEATPMFARIARDGRPFSILSDARRFPVQSKEVGAAFNAIVAASPLRPRRIATLVGDTLSKVQSERLFPFRSMRAFLREDEALAWLAADDG